MTIFVTRLAPCFAARRDGVDVSQPVAEPAWGEIRAAFDEHSVLVETQITFSRRFGALEVTRSMNPAAGRRSRASRTSTSRPVRSRQHPSLPEALKRGVEHATVVHDFSWPRDQVRPGFFTDKERAEYPPVRHPLVRANP
jgi:hypothetical protein